MTLNFSFQLGTYDCGLFSVAFATAAAFGRDPDTCRFDQTKMRKHLYKCFLDGKLTPFPQQKVSCKGGLKTRDDIVVHCYCRIPEMEDFAMIECSACSKWIHVLCDDTNISEEDLNDTGSKWLCQQCVN